MKFWFTMIGGIVISMAFLTEGERQFMFWALALLAYGAAEEIRREALAKEED